MIRELTTGRVCNSITLADPFSDSPVSSWFTISVDDRLVAAGTSAGDVCIWEISSGNLVDRFPAFQLPVDVLEFTPNGKGLLCWTWGQQEWASWDITALDSSLLPSVDSNSVASDSAFQSLSKCKSSSAVPLRSGYRRELTGDWIFEISGSRLYFQDLQTKEARLMLQAHNDDGKRYRKASVCWAALIYRRAGITFVPSPQGSLFATSGEDRTEIRLCRHTT